MKDRKKLRDNYLETYKQKAMSHHLRKNLSTWDCFWMQGQKQQWQQPKSKGVPIYKNKSKKQKLTEDEIINIKIKKVYDKIFLKQKENIPDMNFSTFMMEFKQKIDQWFADPFDVTVWKEQLRKKPQWVKDMVKLLILPDVSRYQKYLTIAGQKENQFRRLPQADVVKNLLKKIIHPLRVRRTQS